MKYVLGTSEASISSRHLSVISLFSLFLIYNNQQYYTKSNEAPGVAQWLVSVTNVF